MGKCAHVAAGDQTAVVLNVQGYSIHDGPGIRTTVFLKGCALRCLWCHNPESQQFRPEVQALAKRLIHPDGLQDQYLGGRLHQVGDPGVELRAVRSLSPPLPVCHRLPGADHDPERRVAGAAEGSRLSASAATSVAGSM